MKRVDIGALVFAMFIPLLIGAASVAISARGMDAYENMNKPPLSPPAWVFSVAWTILYVIMGLASYFIYVSGANKIDKSMALTLYAIQLAMNFMWSIIFFVWGTYLLAFIWLFMMWWIVLVCAFRFFAINKTAAYLLIPYILWLSFAAYLNLGSYVVNLKIE